MLVQDDNRIPADEVQAVCTECGHIVAPGRVISSCPLCGGVTIYVPKGMGEQAKADIKARGHSPLAIQ